MNNISTGSGPTPARQSRQMARAADGARFLAYTIRRFLADQCPARAAALTYTTLLALVPLLAISFAIFAAFPAFEGMREEAQSFIFENFVPNVGSAVKSHLDDFSRQTGRLTAIGVVFLAVTSVMLLANIGSTFDAIWRVRASRRLVARLLAYWAVLTLSPLLLGASLSISGVLFAMARESGVESFTGPLTRMAGLVPPLLQVALLTLLYLLVPFFPVRWRDALMGGTVAGLLLEVLKAGFGLYVTNFPTYQTIYGALATFPIFLMWMYVVWMVVLYGAEMSAALPEWRAGAATHQSGGSEQGRLLAAATAILALLLAASRRGGGVRRRRLLRMIGMEPARMAEAAERLREKRYIDETGGGEWILTRDLEATTLSQLVRDLGLSLEPAWLAAADQPWVPRVAAVVERADAARDELMTMPLRGLLALSADAAEKLAGTGPDTDDEAGVDGDSDSGADVDGMPGDRKMRLLALLGLTWLATR